MSLVFSQGQSAPTQTQRPQSLPLRRSAVNSISRRSKETLTLKSLLSGKSCSTSPPSKTGGASVSSARSKKGEGGAAPSATDFVRVMRTLLFLNRTASKSKGSVNEKETIIKPRRPSLDVSGHSFSKALKAELQRAKEAQGQTDPEAPSRDSSPFQAALQKQHLSQLRSPTKGGFSSYKDWAEEDAKSDTMSRISSTSTLPPSPPPSTTPTRSALPPRCPPKGSTGCPPKAAGGFPPKAGGVGSRRVRQPRAVRAGFPVARPMAEGVVG